MRRNALGKLYDRLTPEERFRLDVLASMRNCKTLEVRFHTLLTQDETEQLEVVRA